MTTRKHPAEQAARHATAQKTARQQASYPEPPRPAKPAKRDNARAWRNWNRRKAVRLPY